MGKTWKETGWKTLKLAYEKALWTVPAYIGWTGLDQAVSREESTKE